MVNYINLKFVVFVLNKDLINTICTSQNKKIYNWVWAKKLFQLKTLLSTSDHGLMISNKLLEVDKAIIVMVIFENKRANSTIIITSINVDEYSNQIWLELLLPQSSSYCLQLFIQCILFLFVLVKKLLLYLLWPQQASMCKIPPTFG